MCFKVTHITFTINFLTMKLLLSAALIGTLLCTSCYTSKVSSNKVTQINTSVQRIFIVAQGSEPVAWGGYILQSVQTELAAKLKQSNVEVGIEPFSPLSLTSNSALEEKIKAFAPDVVATLSADIIEVDALIYVFDLQLEDYTKKEIFWRGQITSVNTLRSTSSKIAKRFHNKLKEDQVLVAR
jgi:hypothetical protein